MESEEQVQEEQAQEAAVEIPKGRSAFLSIIKKRNPDMPEDVDEDTLFDYASKGYAERDDYESQYNLLNGSNEKLGKAIGAIPQLAQWIAEIAAGENPWKALGTILGPKAENLDEASIEALHAGQSEFDINMNRIKANIEKYNQTLDAYVAANNADRDEINNTILDMIDAFIDYDIPEEIIDVVWKGRDYETQRAVELEAARLEGRNAAIEEYKNSKREQTLVPDAGGQSGANKQRKPVIPQAKTTNMADAFVEKE